MMNTTSSSHVARLGLGLPVTAGEQLAHKFLHPGRQGRQALMQIGGDSRPPPLPFPAEDGLKLSDETLSVLRLGERFAQPVHRWTTRIAGRPVQYSLLGDVSGGT